MSIFRRQFPLQAAASLLGPGTTVLKVFVCFDKEIELKTGTPRKVNARFRRKLAGEKYASGKSCVWTA